MFRNLRLYRLPNGISAAPDALAEQLSKGAFKPCGASDRSSGGWIDPHPGAGLVFALDRQRVLCFQIEDKILPSSYVRRCAQAKAEQIEEAQGFKPGRKQMREITEQIEADLLPRAFTKLSRCMVWIDNARGWMAIDGSAARCDDILTSLKLCMDMLPQIGLPRTIHYPGAAMTEWLAAGEAPGSLTIDRDCELRQMTEEKATVKYVHSNLDSEDVRNHIALGKTATRVALTYNDRVSFVLTDQMEIKRIAFLDLLMEDAERQAENADELFAANVALFTGELALVIKGVVDACGGLIDEISDMETAAEAAGNISKLLREDGVSATLTDSSGKALITFNGDASTDPLYPDAKKFVAKEKRASISGVQRSLQIGYNRAARLIEAMEKQGIVSTQDESGERTVLVDAAGKRAA